MIFEGDDISRNATFTALAVIKYYEGRNKNVLVLCPKKLSENWMTYRGNLINNHYDIHWNPVRIIQRFGRIDRIGSRNAVIWLVNFWPDLDLDEYINLKSRVETRMRLM